MEGAVDQAFQSVCIVEANVCVGGAWLTRPKGDVPACTCEVDDQAERGCEDGCANRSMRFECVPGSCPIGERCSNRQLQLGSTLATAVVDYGRKGVGLITLEDVEAGRLVGEYVGEVLSAREANERSQLYRGSRHSYMLRLSASETIDATRFGSRMRFVNHSCSPNCRAEKWSVGGQERCGLFALRLIKAGDKLTIDYQFQHVDFGDAVECLCGSDGCRGVIGGRKRKRLASDDGQVRQETSQTNRTLQLTMDQSLVQR